MLCVSHQCEPSEYIPNWISKIEFPQLFQIFAQQLFTISTSIDEMQLSPDKTEIVSLDKGYIFVPTTTCPLNN